MLEWALELPARCRFLARKPVGICDVVARTAIHWPPVPSVTVRATIIDGKILASPRKNQACLRYHRLNRQIQAETPPSLLLRLRDHQDQAAWATFTEVYSPLVYNFCRLRKLQPSDAADVTQEVLVRISKAITKFDYDRQQGLFRDWVAKIVANEVCRHFSNRKPLTTLADDWESEAASSQWNDHFQQHIFESAMARCRGSFSPQTWLLFEKCWLEKLPASEVAEACSVNVTQVYIAKSRVLKRLQKEVSLLADDWQ